MTILNVLQRTVHGEYRAHSKDTANETTRNKLVVAYKKYTLRDVVIIMLNHLRTRSTLAFY